MPDDFHKLWVQSSLNRLAENRALEQIQNTGRALPCSVIAVDGPIVQVSFQVTGPQTLPPLMLPVGESQWMRLPVQIGDTGMTVPADTFLGGISGLGSGIADTTVNYGNLTTLIFVPIGNTNFPAMPDPNRAWVNGPNGFDSTDTLQTGGIRYDAQAQTVTIFAGEQTIVLTADPSLISSITGTLGELQTIVDGAGNTISQVVPTGGGVALGKVFSALGTARAAAANADLATLSNGPAGIVQQTLVNLMGALGTTIGGAPATWPAAQAAIAAALALSTFVTDIPNIQPTIPGCSSIVRLAE